MKQKKILAVASSGGHFVQLLRLKPIFSQYNTSYMSTDRSLKSAVQGKFYSINDASLWNKWGLIIMACNIFIKLLIIRPNVVISTGAAPGYFAILFGKLVGAKTIWLDSIANVDEMSLAGKKVKIWADLWLTQWPDLEEDEGPKYFGQVI